jgi:Ca2+-binding RTX toxin-like protein
MTDHTGLVITGGETRDQLTVKVVLEDNGDRSIYNVIYGGSGNDRLSGWTFEDSDVFKAYGVQLFGGTGADTLSDSLGTDTLNGGEGNDTIEYRSGHDVIDGGEGTDTLFVGESTLISSKSQSLSSIERLSIYDHLRVGDFDLSTFQLLTVSSGSARIKFTEAVTNIENVAFGNIGIYVWALAGSGYDDRFDLSASTRNFFIDGGEGNDVLIGGLRKINIDGGGGDDSITGTAKHDVLTGGADNDIVFGGAGADAITETKGQNTLHGGEGDDLISTRGSDNRIFGDEGNDEIRLQRGSADVDAGDGDDTIYLLAPISNDGPHWHLRGGDGKDELTGGYTDFSNASVEGIEILTLYGSKPIIGSPETLASFDTFRFSLGMSKRLDFRFSEGGDFVWHKDQHDGLGGKITGTDDIETIDLHASKTSWTVRSGGGDDVVVGSSGSSKILGEAGNDTLKGGRGYDSISGGDGNDTFLSSGGLDEVSGDFGKDTFVFTRNSGTTTFKHFDHSGDDGDVIDLSATSIRDFGDMIDNHTTNVYPGYLTIYFGGSEIKLAHGSVKYLHESDFIF